MNSANISFEIAALRNLYADRKKTIVEIAEIAWQRSARAENAEAWIAKVPLAELIEEAKRLQVLFDQNSDALTRWPLLGIPFAIKDNINVGGIPTTAACPDFSHLPDEHATVVKNLIDAGALFIGKTNMDQFATGLVGTRSPYGIPKNPFDAKYITGGSSSGSALAVSTGMVSFALGTDTAGSGRVPAAFNNIVGVKPTRGLISTNGVVPACASLDCVSVFALTVADAENVLQVAQGFDAGDSYSRAKVEIKTPAWAFRFGVPKAGQLDFSGDSEYAMLFDQARKALRKIGGVEVEIDICVFLRAAILLYQGPWLAERAEAIGAFADANPKSILPVLSEILAPAKSISGIDTFKGLHALQSLIQEALPLWNAMDFLLLPTTPTIFKREQIAEQPLALNSVLGRFTNFVNLMDLSAIAVPAGFRPDGLPFGVSFIAPAFSEPMLFRVAAAWEKHQGLFLGATGLSSSGPSTRFVKLDDVPLRDRLPLQQPIDSSTLHSTASHTSILVFGLHMSDQPLNHELTSLGATFEKSVRTSARYKMAALRRGEKRLPGVWRQAENVAGVSLEGEVWSVPNESVGAFFTKVPPPLCLGSVELEDGSWVKSFLAESVACEAAEDVSSFGGWRGYLKATY